LLTRSPARELAEEATGSRKFLGNPDCPFAHVQSTPAGLRSPDHCGGAAWPLGSQKQGLPRKVFRRSIAWLSDWLSPLRGAGYPRPAPDSLPAAGQALPGGLSTRRVPLKGFRGRFPTSHPPFPSFLPQSDRPKHPGPNFAARCPQFARHPRLVNFYTSRVRGKQAGRSVHRSLGLPARPPARRLAARLNQPSRRAVPLPTRPRPSA